MLIDENIIPKNGDAAGFSSFRPPSGNNGKFKEAMLNIFSSMNDLTLQYTDENDPGITIDGVKFPDKTGAAATFMIGEVMERYQNQAALIMKLVNDFAKIDEKAANL